MVLQLKQLFITSCVGDFDGAYKLDSTLQNSSEDQLLTVLLHGFEKFALNVNKEIIRLTVSYLKVSGRFVQSFFWPTTFVFIFYFSFFSFYQFICYPFMSYCTRLTVSDYILLEFCVLFHPQFYVLFFIFIVLLLISIVSDC